MKREDRERADNLIEQMKQLKNTPGITGKPDPNMKPDQAVIAELKDEIKGNPEIERIVNSLRAAAFVIELASANAGDYIAITGDMKRYTDCSHLLDGISRELSGGCISSEEAVKRITSHGFEAEIITAPDEKEMSDPDYEIKNGHTIYHYHPGEIRAITYLPIPAANANFPIRSLIKVTKATVPTDKANRAIFLDLQSTGDQIAMGELTVHAKGKKTSPAKLKPVFYYQLDNINLGAKDRRIYIACNALYEAGNNDFTVNALYKVAGGHSDPDTKTAEEWLDRVVAMMNAEFTYSCDYLDKAGRQITLADRGGHLLPGHVGTANVNGVMTDSAIHIDRTPPLIKFAKSFGNEVTTIPVEILQSPLRMTDENLRIEDYLIDRISKAKHGSLRPIILLSSLYEDAKISTQKQKYRAPEKIRKLLNFYKESWSDTLADYTMDREKITLVIAKEKALRNG